MLLDTSGLLCLFDEDESRHEEAESHFDEAVTKLTHSYVLAEFVALAQARRAPRGRALTFVARLQDSSEVEVVYVDKALHREALALLRQRLDKEWSLSDAVSFLLMPRRGLTEALTTDHHFEQAGFVSLLRT
ncbi:MAG: type II toxin-antitoxin system VapC family toxin [Planctomycetes bacterium]|nr:type II toxin-antitoxin system VapC family toxin [Planctomycetota bacterium]MBM4080885.1 type II toxin-antitoxin system VapC family toxin [Planctomycetota bacterium]